MANLVLTTLSEALAVCRLPAHSAVPAWATDGPFLSVTKTKEELSIVCLENVVPEGVKREGPWRALKVQGPLDFALTGILASLAQPLAEAKISIFAISTFDTDYLLVKAGDLDRATAALAAVGHHVSPSRDA